MTFEDVHTTILLVPIAYSNPVFFKNMFLNVTFRHQRKQHTSKRSSNTSHGSPGVPVSKMH
jgi:hypothetical protein